MFQLNTFRFNFLKLFLFASLGFSSYALFAGNTSQMLNSLNEIQKDPEAFDSALKMGKERAVLCGYCHGKNGNSVKDYIPNLAGQNPEYLLIQFEKFGNGERKNYVMSQLAKNMEFKDKVNLALYYSNFPVETKISTAPVNHQTQELYINKCALCHGNTGEGNQQLPRIAGQPSNFLVSTLKKFRDKQSDRNNSLMENITQDLSDENIEQLANYISTL